MVPLSLLVRHTSCVQVRGGDQLWWQVPAVMGPLAWEAVVLIHWVMACCPATSSLCHQ